jgi:hypothetical protein
MSAGNDFDVLLQRYSTLAVALDRLSIETNPQLAIN